MLPPSSVYSPPLCNVGSQTPLRKCSHGGSSIEQCPDLSDRLEAKESGSCGVDDAEHERCATLRRPQRQLFARRIGFLSHVTECHHPAVFPRNRSTRDVAHFL